jgi:antitoxin (DNA-binding transcriptional repressor) of toxin-antitoxin stability system
MTTVNVHEAKTTLSALLAQVERGEEVIIARNGEPVARLSRYQPAPVRQKGSWRALPGWEAFRHDPALLAPMTDQEMADEGWP